MPLMLASEQGLMLLHWLNAGRCWRAPGSLTISRWCWHWLVATNSSVCNVPALCHVTQACNTANPRDNVLVLQARDFHAHTSSPAKAAPLVVAVAATFGQASDVLLTGVNLTFQAEWAAASWQRCQ